MTNKKKRWMMARELRKQGIDFIPAQKMARYLFKGELYFYEALRQGEFQGEPLMKCVCARGCCREESGFLYRAKNEKGESVTFTCDNLNKIARSY